MRTIWPLLYHSNLLLLFSSFFIHSGFAKICSVSFTYLSQNRIQSFYILQKSNRVPLLYLVTLPHYLGITQVYFLFFDIFPPFYGIITVTVRQNPSQQLFYIFTPKQVLCQSEIYLFLSARLFTFSFCCMFSACQSVSEKCFTQDVRHNLWEILFGWGRRSGLRQPNSDKISRKVGRADCGNDFSDTL